MDEKMKGVETSEDLQGMEEYDFCLWWQENYPRAYFALGEACGLVVNRQGHIYETAREGRNPERADDIFDALKALVEIDPDGRR